MSLTPGRAGSGLLAGNLRAFRGYLLQFLNSPICWRTPDSSGRPLRISRRREATGSEFRLCPVKPNEEGLSGPPAPTGMSARGAPQLSLLSAASPAHFLSPTDPTTKHAHTHACAHTDAQTHTDTHTSWRAQRPRSWLGDPRRLGSGRSDLCYSNSPLAGRWATVSGRENRSIARPPHPSAHGSLLPAAGAPRADFGISRLPGARRGAACWAAPPPPLVRAAASASRSAPSPSPPPLPLPFPSFLRSSRGPAAAAAFPGVRGPCQQPSLQHGTIGAGLAGSSIWGKRIPRGGGCPAASVMDVSKMVSEEQGLCPGASPRPPHFPLFFPLPVGLIH